MSTRWWALLWIVVFFLPTDLSGQERKRVLPQTGEQGKPRFIIVANGQKIQFDPPPRYVPIPFDGNPEAVLEELLGQAREADVMRKLIADIERDAKRLDFDSVRKQIDALGQKNPEIRKLFKDAGVDKMLAKGKNQKAPTKEETKKLQDAVTKALDKVQATPPPAAKPSSGASADRPVPPPPSLDERAREWLRDVLEDARYASWFRELLQDSPGLEESVNDLIRSLEAGGSDEGWLRDLSLPLDVWDKVSSLSLPNLPEVHLPVPELSTWRGGDRVSMPGFPTGGVPSAAAILLLAALLALLLIAWCWLRAKGRTKLTRPGWRLGPWPVLPQNVRTREQFMQAFEYLALLMVGVEARVSNHRSIAERMIAVAPRRREAVNELTDLYEQARYAPGNDMSSAALDSVRCHLCQLAGVKP